MLRQCPNLAMVALSLQYGLVYTITSVATVSDFIRYIQGSWTFEYPGIPMRLALF